MAVACVLAAIVLVVMDSAITNVALPTFARSFQVTPEFSVWVVTAYQMALVMALLPSAALGESLGYGRVFKAGVAVFIAASVLCAASPSLPWLIAARFLQGIGGAAVMALGVALLRFIVPKRLLGGAIGWNALDVALSSAAGEVSENSPVRLTHPRDPDASSMLAWPNACHGGGQAEMSPRPPPEGHRDRVPTVRPEPARRTGLPGERWRHPGR
jgi:hypothetical protein